MADHSEERARLDYLWRLHAIEAAREEGRKEGWEVGYVIGQIQAAQSLLGEEESSMADLCDVPTNELAAKLTDLQQRLRSRGD